MEQFKYLVMVTTDGSNHNKYYRMIQHGNTFTAEYGRVGATCQKRDYPMSAWNQKYEEKLAKGYIDQTTLHELVTKQVTSGYNLISDADIQQLVDSLLVYAKMFVKENYSVGFQAVTAKMVHAAQKRINDLGSCSTVSEFNKILQDLWTIIPRRMGDPACFMANEKEDFAKCLLREQQTLNVMKSLVKDNGLEPEESSGKTILDAMGLEVKKCTEKELEQCKKFLGESAGRMKAAYRVENRKLEERFSGYCEKNDIQGNAQHFLYHGTKNANVWGVLTKGLLTNPNAPITGKMFGYGLYFATRAKKSIGYTSVPDAYWNRECDKEGFLFVFKVAYKNPLQVIDQYNSAYGSFKAFNIERTGHDALFAHKGMSYYGKTLKNDEIIVYREEQAIPRYLIQIV